MWSSKDLQVLQNEILKLEARKQECRWNSTKENVKLSHMEGQSQIQFHYTLIGQ